MTDDDAMFDRLAQEERIATLEHQLAETRALEEAAVERLKENIIEQLKERIYIRLNNHLIEMKPDCDDAVEGFCEAWNIVRGIFNEDHLGSSYLERQLAEARIEIERLRKLEAAFMRGDLKHV